MTPIESAAAGVIAVEEDEDKNQEEIDELEAKLSDLQGELNLTDEQFEQRLLKRLEQEIKIN